jgi:hypothetical protein
LQLINNPEKMKHLLYTLFFVLSLSLQHLSAQTEFYNTFSSTATISILAYSVDSDGNYILCGFFEGAIDLDPGVGISNFTSAGLQDIFIVKLNPQGQLMWAKTYGAQMQDFAEDILIDADNNIWLCGTFQRNVNFNPGGEGGLLMNSNGTTGGNRSNSFLMMLNPAGEFQKIYHFRNAAPGADNNFRSFEVDCKGNFTIFGTFSGILNADPFTNSFPLSTANPNTTSSTTFIARIDPNADTLMWAKHFDGPSTFRLLSDIVCDSDANVYGVGAFNGTFNLNQDVDSLILTSENEALFIFKMNSFGEYTWARTLSSSGSSRCTHVMLDESSLYVLGRYNATLEFNTEDPAPSSIQTNGENDVFLLKMDMNGNYNWARSWGNETNADGPQGINMGADGRILASLSFTNTVDANPGAGEQVITSAGGADFYVVSLTAEGEYMDVLHGGGSESDFVFDAAYDNGVYTLLGTSRATFLLNPPLPASAINVPASTASFLARFAPSGASTNMEQTLSQESIIIYPNPARDFIQIKTEVPIDHIELYDLQGRKLQSIRYPQGNSIQLNHLESGVYFIRASSRNQLFSKKIIISN